MTKTAMPYNFALQIAQAFTQSVRDQCERIEIAGSTRRKKETIGDIEVVCIPRFLQTADLFGSPNNAVSLLDPALAQYDRIIGKDHHRQYILCRDPQYGDITLDLFITTRECWGSVFTIRTGSADFSHWLVTKRQQGGACPGYIDFKDARLWCHGKAIETPEEADVFKALRLEWIPPEERIEGRWRK